MAFDSLDIQIGADTGSATAAIETVKSSLLGLESEANDAQDSMEELGDEASQTTGRLAGLATTAGATATTLAGLTTAGSGASSSLTALATSAGTGATLLGGLLAVAAPLAATLGTVATAAGGVATAFGAIIGSGLLAFGERLAGQMDGVDSATKALAKRAKQLKQRISALVAEFGVQFIPLIQDAINGIVPLTRDILEAIGPLDSFRQALRDLGGSAREAIPTVVSEVVNIGRQALPVLRDLTERAGDVLPQAFEAMQRVTEQVGDDLLALASAVVDVIPELTRLGVLIIETATPILRGLIDVIETLIGTVNTVASAFRGDFGSAIGTIKQVITGFVGYLATQAIKNLKKRFRAIGLAIGTIARDIYNALTGDGDSVLKSIIGDFVEYLKTDAVDDIQTALDVLFQVMLQGAGALAQGFADGFGNISFQPLIESFNSVANTINGFIEGINSQFGMIDIGARVPTVSGDILEGGVSIGGGSGGSDGSDGIDFDFGGSDGSGDSGDSGSDDGFDFDFDFDFGGDTGSGTTDGATGSEGGEEMPADEVDTSPNEDTAGLGGQFAGGQIDLQALADMVTEMNLPQKLREGIRNDTIDWTVDTISPFTDEYSAVRPYADVEDFAPFTNEILKRASARAAGGNANYTYPLSDTVSDLVKAFPSISANDIPTLNTGGLIDSGGLSMLHAGERVVPEAQVSDRGPAPVEGGGVTIEELHVTASGRREGREAGKALRDELNRFNIG